VTTFLHGHFDHFDSDKIAGILKNKRQSDPRTSISEDEGGHSGGVECELRVRLDGGRIYTTT
jgi:hypothetical protein